MHRPLKCLSLALSFALGCSSSGGGTPSTDASTVDVPQSDAPRADAQDAGDASVDRPRVDSGCPVDPTPTGASVAGAMCTGDAQCGGGPLTCDDGIAGGYCTTDYMISTAQACEQAQCGGRGATCLSLGDGADAVSFCAPTCTPTARAGNPGACRAGTVCTGWWYTHDSAEPDATGCEYFCQTDAQCGAGARCFTRTGECGDEAVVMTRRPDGSPCDPTLETGDPPMNTQCRGVCFRETDDPRQGICGSLVNLAATPDCPDNPTRIRAIAPSDDNGRTDNLGMCIYLEDCVTDAECMAPLRCIPGTDGEASYCGYDDGTLPPADAGVRPDASATDAAVTDASAADASDAAGDR